MLELRQVRKSYNDSAPILDIAALTLATGTYWLQGANGTGKTTLIRILAGIVPFLGDTLINGHSQRREPVAYRQLIGWADAEPLYPGFLTGQELVNFYSRILHPESNQIAYLLQRLQIGDWIGTRLAGWSSGMTKKLALLLAFLGRPTWILLDEPLITLDEAGLAGLLTLIGEYRDRYGAGFLLSSHQLLPTGRLPGTQNLILINRSIQLSS
ncbi:MAG TPA: ATP-binding cassette domain-containing protein [Puia sp.]|uniref:ABC transporter ATP-binding protein n=1 Tax=Puia sp. TaxID=2045100 RepID=UPI002C1EAF03|nr:ATP-binding cassette domain-containing protein [Puia sp.]HVU96328.1 ATP-binding cassette domain-containing protein [Puia sp.]